MATKGKTNGAISDFINSLASSPIVKGAEQTVENLGQTFQVPVQTIGHAILPKIIPQTTPQQNQQAQAGAEFGMAPYSLADPANSALGSVVDTGVTAAKPAVKTAVQTTKAQPGGFQAGFINFGSDVGGSGVLYDDKGNLVTKPQGGNGDQFTNPQTGQPFKGGTKAQIQARTLSTPNLQYNQGGAMKEPIADESASTDLPLVGAKPNQGGTPPPPPPKEPGPSPETDYSRTYDIKDPQYSTPSKADQLENTKRNLTIDGDDIRDVQHKEQVDTTMNNYNIKGTQTQQLRMLNDSIDTLSKRAKANVSATGGTISKTDLVNTVAKNLIKVSGKNDMNPDEIMKIAENEVNSSYARVKGVGPNGELNITAPDQIPGIDVQSMKKDFNDNAAGTFGQPVSSWTKAQKVARPARDAVDALLDEQYPDASKLNNDMSDMYAAKDSLRKGTIKEGNAAQAAANTPKQPFSVTDTFMGKSSGLLPPIIKKPLDAIFATPKRALITGGVVGGTIGLPPIIQGFGQKKEHSKGPQGQQGQQNNGVVGANNIKDKHNNGSIQQYASNVNNIPESHAIKDSSGNALDQSIGTITPAITKLIKQNQGLVSAAGVQNYLNLPPTAANQYKTNEEQIKLLQTQQGTAQKFIDQHLQANQQYQGLETAKQIIAKASPTWWTILSKGNPIEQWWLQQQPDFQKWQNALSNIPGHPYLGGVLTAGSSDVANSIINQQEQQNKSNYQSWVKDNGGSWPSDTQNAPTRQGATPLKFTNFSTKPPVPTMPTLPPIGNNSQFSQQPNPAMASVYH